MTTQRFNISVFTLMIVVNITKKGAQVRVEVDFPPHQGPYNPGRGEQLSNFPTDDEVFIGIRVKQLSIRRVQQLVVGNVLSARIHLQK